MGSRESDWALIICWASHFPNGKVLAIVCESV